MLEIVIIVIIIALILPCYYIKYKRNEKIRNAQRHGILIDGEHYKVYKVYRSSSYTDGGVYVKHHGVHDFHEIMLISPKDEQLFITEKHLFYCLKVRKHSTSIVENGKTITRWAEWEIDPKGRDEKGLGYNEVYLFLY